MIVVNTEMAINECNGCRFFVNVQGFRETRFGCIRKHRTPIDLVPAVIYVMELLK